MLTTGLILGQRSPIFMVADQSILEAFAFFDWDGN
jgi:hypothetical protein